MIVVMVRIPVGSAEEGQRIAERFRNNLGLADHQPGFLGFELLKGEHEYVSVTRWASRADLERWTASQAHSEAHAHSRPQAPQSGGHPSGISDEILGQLTEEERRIVQLRYGLNDDTPRTPEEVAHVLGISRERVRQIELTILGKMRGMQHGASKSPASSTIIYEVAIPQSDK